MLQLALCRRSESLALSSTARQETGTTRPPNRSRHTARERAAVLLHHLLPHTRTITDASSFVPDNIIDFREFSRQREAFSSSAAAGGIASSSSDTTRTAGSHECCNAPAAPAKGDGSWWEPEKDSGGLVDRRRAQLLSEEDVAEDSQLTMRTAHA